MAEQFCPKVRTMRKSPWERTFSSQMYIIFYPPCLSLEVFISCFHKWQTFQFENFSHHLSTSNILRGVKLAQGDFWFNHGVHFCEFRHVNENSNYFFLNLWVNAVFLECCSFICVDVACHYYKASLLQFFYWFFPYCAFVVSTESTVFCSHSWFFCNIRCLIIFFLFYFFSISRWLLLQTRLVFCSFSRLSGFCLPCLDFCALGGCFCGFR